MHYDLTQTSPENCYKLMIGLVVPRPIAWITTCNSDGSINAAPFSFFNAIGTDPPLVVVGIGNHPDRPKDTASNILRSKELVVNLVPHALAQAMSDSAADYPANVSEIDALGLETLPSLHVAPPRIVGCPASLECKLERVVEVGGNRVIFALVLGVHVQDDVMLDREKYRVDSPKMDLIGRMGGLGGYATTRDTFQVERKRFGSS
jgi:flavin reductase (DIM6/NTAB) family NADH-FMN oxidoreductase RutF